MLEPETTSKIARLRPYLSAKEAAQFLRTSQRAIYSLIERGQFGTAVLRLGRRILIKRKALVALLESQRQ